MGDNKLNSFNLSLASNLKGAHTSRSRINFGMKVPKKKPKKRKKKPITTT